ncbi:MAG: hypothetical protein HC893_12855 [Chloroflexaceae bacterium]|nr:hypothetical protein [Chloroflexaceae bacterium]
MNQPLCRHTEHDYWLFIQVLNKQGERMAQRDAPLRADMPPPLPAGSYILQIGLYDVSTWAQVSLQNVPTMTAALYYQCCGLPSKAALVCASPVSLAPSPNLCLYYCSPKKRTLDNTPLEEYSVSASNPFPSHYFIRYDDNDDGLFYYPATPDGPYR